MGVSLYYHTKDAYQYIVAFDSNLGDLPALSANAANTLYEVTDCNPPTPNPAL